MCTVLLTPRELVKAFFEIDLFLNPRIRNLDDAMDLDTQIYIVRIGIVLRIQASLSLEVLLVDAECAVALFQIEEIAIEVADFVVEHEHAEPNFESHPKVRVDIAFDLGGNRKLVEELGREARQVLGILHV